MSRKSDDEVYGPPHQPTLGNILPDNPSFEKKDSNKGLADFAESQIKNQILKAKIFPADLDDPDKSVTSNAQNETAQLTGGKRNQVGIQLDNDTFTGAPTSNTSEKGTGGFFNKNLKEYHDFIQVKLVEGVDKTVRTGKQVASDVTDLNDKSKEALKEKAMQINYFQGQAQKIMKYDGKALEAQEPERDFSPTFGYIKLAVLAVIGVLAIIYVLVANFSKIGTEKSQQVSILKYNDLTYYVGDDVGGIASLFPIHMFTTLNKQQVLDRMECLVNQNTTMCNKYEERQCEVYGLKNQDYDTCMLLQYEKAGMDLRSFCNNHYNTSNGLWEKSEYTSNAFYVAKHECLMNAGIKRGVEYCQDQNVLNPALTDKDLYKCYADYKVSNVTYAAAKCNYEYPKDSTDLAIRTNYMVCMKNMTVPVDIKQQCVYDYFWQFDTKFVKTCEALLIKMYAGTITDEKIGEMNDNFQCQNQTCVQSPGAEGCGGEMEDMLDEGFGDEGDITDLNLENFGNIDDFGGFRRRLESTPTDYDSITVSQCKGFFDQGNCQSECFAANEKALKYDNDMCNTVVWLTHGKSSMESQGTNFTPDPEKYFECYYKETQMKDTEKYMPQKIDACDKLYPNDQRNLLKCYRYIGHPYGLNDQIKICTEEYKKLSELDQLYECMAEFGVEKDEEYCNLSPKVSQFIDEDEARTHIYADPENLSGEPYFKCIIENTEATKSDARKCVEALNLRSTKKLFGLPTEEINYDEMSQCFKDQDMPLKGVQEGMCTLKHLVTQPSGFISTGKICETEEQWEGNYEVCNMFWEPLNDEYDDCNWYYQNSYVYEFEGDKAFLKDYGVFCKAYELITTEYDKCMLELTDEVALTDMNDKLQAFLTTQNKADSFAPYASVNNKTLVNYCETRFSKKVDTHNRIICLEIIIQPLGAQECLILPENIDTENFYFSYFYKYMCLYMKKVEFDTTAQKCLLPQDYQYKWGYMEVSLDRPFVEINDCLENYEKSDENTEMKLKKVNSLTLYTQITKVNLSNLVVEDDEDAEPVIVYDNPTNLTHEQISDFLCNETMSLDFHTSPFSIKNDKNKYVKYNSMSFQMGCEVFNQYNGTMNNTVVHFSFQERDTYGYEALVFDDAYDKNNVTVNRTDTNDQHFNLTMGEDIDFLQVQSHVVYTYEEEGMPTRHSIQSGEEFEEFVAKAQTSGILKTTQMVIYDQITQTAELDAEPLKIILVDKTATRKVLGVGVEFEDVNKKQASIKKINTVIPTENRDDLSDERQKEMHSFIMNLRLDFNEQTVIYQYFSFMDIVGLLGGLWATFKSLTAQLGVVSIVLYVYNLGQMIKRKDHQRYRILEIKQYLKHIPVITQTIEKQIDDKPTKKNQELRIDLENCTKAEEIPTTRYDTTIEKHELLKELVGKYFPSGLEDIFGHTRCKSEWEMLENIENETKHRYFEKKMAFSLADISDEIKERMSFYGIYMTKDRQDMGHIKVKKIKYQLRDAHKRIQEQDKVNMQLVDRLERLEKKLQ